MLTTCVNMHARMLCTRQSPSLGRLIGIQRPDPAFATEMRRLRFEVPDESLKYFGLRLRHSTEEPSELLCSQYISRILGVVQL